MKRIIFGIVIVIIIGLIFLKLENASIPKNTTPNTSDSIISGEFDQNKNKSEEDWKKILTSEQYHILREAG